MSFAIKFRRKIDRFFGREYSVVGNGPDKSLVVYHDELYSIDIIIDGKNWTCYRDSIRRLSEENEAEQFATETQKNMVIEAVTKKYKGLIVS